VRCAAPPSIMKNVHVELIRRPVIGESMWNTARIVAGVGTSQGARVAAMSLIVLPAPMG